jgi:heptosyltransferase I
MDLPATAASANSTATPDPRRLLIVRLGSMGDIFHTLPAATALRHAFPEATLGWIVEERWAELLCTLAEPRCGPRSPRRPLVDCVHAVNTKRWRTSLLSVQTWERIAAAGSDLRAQRYEVAVDFQGAMKSAACARWSGAPASFGFAQPRENAASMFYTRQVIAQGTHMVEQNLSLAEAVARRPLKLRTMECPWDDAAEKYCEKWLRHDAISNFALMNPGAGWGAKQWPAKRYGQVAKRLREDGLQSLINVGPGEETLSKEVEVASAGAAHVLNCSLSQLIAFTRRAKLFIGGDTGPMHMAAALGVPVVAIFGPTNPARNGPFGTRSIVLRSPSSLTTHARRAAPDAGLLEISVDQVTAAARQLLRESRG